METHTQAVSEPTTFVPLILEIRGFRAMLDADLAAVYGVSTKALNQAVKRNIDRFPADFAFRLTRAEAARLPRSRSQSVTLKRGGNLKYQPLAFTEHGALMAANILRTARAVEMGVFVVRAFVRLRELTYTSREVAARLDALERRVAGHDGELQATVAALRSLLVAPATPRRRIGFRQAQ